MSRSEMSLMAPLAKPVSNPRGSTASLARSSSLEGSTISDHLSGPGADRRGGGAGQVRRVLNPQPTRLQL